MINQIFNENCLETMFRMPNDFVDLTVTSPPYDNLKQYQGYDFDFKSIAQQLFRVTKNNGVLVWIVGDSTLKGSESGTSFRQALYFKDLGFNIHDTMIFEKNSSTYPASPLSNRYTQIFEYMFILTKGKPQANLICDKPNKWAGFRDYSNKLKNPVREYGVRTNIWRYVTSMNSSGHPAPFPLDLAKDHVLSWSNIGDLVYDPFMGSGTTALACLDLNRNYIGSEISAEYCVLIDKRINSKITINKTTLIQGLN